MKLQTFILAALFSATIFVSGCGKLIHNSPAEVSTRLEMACNAGKYTQAEGYLSSSAQTFIRGPRGAANGGMQGVCNQQTRNGTLQRVEIIKVEVRGEGARVDYRLHFKDGSTKDDHDDLIKENGEWKVNFG